MVFVSDIDRLIYLFQEFFGFKLDWRETLGGPDISSLVGIDNIEVEVAFLQSRNNGVAVELLRLKNKGVDGDPARFGVVNSTGLSLVVDNMDNIYTRLGKEGWPPLTPPQEVLTPGGESVRIFFFRTDDGLTIELIERVGITGN
jgi:catechol 2,3-dioxygenase-like lactoylglutathione lyase family enzyme